jgi:hypothetical protein
MTANYVTTLTLEQSQWCAANGVRFEHIPAYRLSVFSKGELSIEMVAFDARYPRTSFDVARQPTRELDGPDMNDGEPVVVASLPTLRAALGCLARGGK